MNRKLLKDKFGNIPQSVFNKMGSKERQPIAKYNNMMSKIEEWYVEVEDLKDEIKELIADEEKNIISSNSMCSQQHQFIK